MGKQPLVEMNGPAVGRIGKPFEELDRALMNKGVPVSVKVSITKGGQAHSLTIVLTKEAALTLHVAIGDRVVVEGHARTGITIRRMPPGFAATDGRVYTLIPPGHSTNNGEARLRISARRIGAVNLPVAMVRRAARIIPAQQGAPAMLYVPPLPEIFVDEAIARRAKRARGVAAAVPLEAADERVQRIAEERDSPLLPPAVPFHPKPGQPAPAPTLAHAPLLALADAVKQVNEAIEGAEKAGIKVSGSVEKKRLGDGMMLNLQVIARLT